MPNIDEGGFVFDFFGPPGASVTEMDRLLVNVQKILMTSRKCRRIRATWVSRWEATSPNRTWVTVLSASSRFHGGRLMK